jgi:hypothetical protein
MAHVGHEEFPLDALRRDGMRTEDHFAIAQAVTPAIGRFLKA